MSLVVCCSYRLITVRNAIFGGISVEYQSVGVRLARRFFNHGHDKNVQLGWAVLIESVHNLLKFVKNIFTLKL